MTSSSLHIRAAQVMGVGGAAFVAGGNVVTILVACPALLQAPSSLLLNQWHELYDRGLKVVVPLALISAASFGYLAFETYRSDGTNGSKFKLYMAATAAAISYGPFMRLVMGNCIGRFMELGEMGAKADGHEIRTQVETWTYLNGNRGGMTAVGAAIGALTASASFLGCFRHVSRLISHVSAAH